VLDKVQPIVAADHFYSDANRKIFEAFVDLSANGRPIDILTVRSWLDDRGFLQRVGGAKYLAEILDAVPAVSNVDDYAKRIREKWRVRELISACRRVAAEGYGTIEDVQKFIDSAEQTVYDIARTPESTTVMSLRDVIQVTFTRITDSLRRGSRITGTPTGFTRLDKLTGGLNEGDLTIVAARPGMGKTSLVLNMAVNVALPKEVRSEDAEGGEEYRLEQGAGVAIFSLEMPREQLATRLLCSEGRVDVSKVRQGGLQRDDWSRLTKAAGELSKLPIWIDDTSDLSVLELRAKVRRIQSMQGDRGKLGLVMIDYLQLMSGNPKASSREQQISEISRNLKKLAKDLSVPVIALSQLNRAVETRGTKDKRPQLSDLRESGAIEQDADTIVFIYRDDYYNPEDPSVAGLAELIVAKQRNGPTGRIKVRFTKSCTRFDNLAEEEYGEEEPG
ncbi:MAG TPA: replicative DNA helicase, partial [Polyangiaceae bacterium]|nr:replicative DNA helicase [Polyangiaceae bacterium]